ncbi:hypothetical protein FV196_10855 [Rothia dentocariosa]|uniref:hypothetical protein n=1 Tax=Rothia dentocariosa TaxID=2047 RepID=UPI00145594E6|nr:hypothetical protein [Rothia dentocariosa]NLR26571.1 hypothetical protein [Rothia dentocariosa]
MFDEDEEPQATPVLKVSSVEPQSSESLPKEPSFIESEDPITTPVLQPNELNEKREKTRAYYGYILLLALVMIYGFSMTIYSLDLTSTAARMDHLMTTIVTSIQTLVASVIGFYFGSERK